MATSQPSEVGSDAAACRRGCGACCIAPSITSPLPKMPAGKPAGERCAHLTEAMDCELFGRPERPAVCGGLQPSQEMCGASREHAMVWLGQLEKLTAPAASLPRGTQAAMPPHR
ncbi:zinc/iron-chelating domain-containing protein [Bordetella genomosp. 9]|uniref:Zinc/iron-chelating domain-containing protein n=1 Tax=Bordetella genomosp. 9 TaxID=1416803 RepID=A0A1W6YYT9_9BORD|nr:zinc/iron-chelating domain-containing protein [Bordetella genomosp. 9]ARP86114.1 zinc/iron-chelating domain-containing protein [Bordetella genomosp. 9]